jgi:hypothetical protein
MSADKASLNQAVPFAIGAGSVLVVTAAPLWATGAGVVLLCAGTAVGLAGLGYGGYQVGKWLKNRKALSGARS